LALSVTQASAHDRVRGIREQLLGCWVKHFDRPVDEKTGRREPFPIAEYCFHTDKKIVGFFIEIGGEGGDLERTWNLRRSGILEIDGEACKFRLDATASSFSLSACSFDGTWVRGCEELHSNPECLLK